MHCHLLQVGDEAGVGGHGPLAYAVGGFDAAGQPPHCREECLGHRGRHPVEGSHRRVDPLGPGVQVAAARLGPDLGRGVFPVVARQVQVRQVKQRVALVLLKLAEVHAEGLFEDPEMALVVGIGLGETAKAGETRAHPSR